MAPIEEKSDDSTFKILLLVVGGLLIVVGFLLLANTYVNRKQNMGILADREELRAARFQA